MYLSTFVVGSVGLIITLYSNYYQRVDLRKTLQDLERDLSLPRIKTYDFIVGKRVKWSKATIISSPTTKVEMSL
jgi:hypothetical protein